MRHPLFLLIPLLIGCTAAEESARVQITVEDGVTVARTTGGALFAGNIFTFEPIVRLHQDPANIQSLMTAPTQFLEGPHGRYYVPDYRDGRIAVFDAQGHYVQDIGRRGEGPGEFVSLRLQSIIGDTISTFDFQLQRGTRFGTDGHLIDVFRLPIGGGFAVGLQCHPDGRLIVDTVEGTDRNGVGSTSSRVTIYASAGDDTLGHVATGFVEENQMQMIEMPDGSVSTLSSDMPYASHASCFYIPGLGIVATEGEQPEIRRYDLRGRLTHLFVAELEERPLTEAVKSAYEERLWQRRVERARELGREPQPVREIKYPDSIGFFGWATGDQSGYVWLADVWSTAEHSEERGFVFHVFDPAGRYLGLAEAPASRFRIQGDKLMAIIEDPDTGENVPTVFRIVPAIDGLTYGSGGTR